MSDLAQSLALLPRPHSPLADAEVLAHLQSAWQSGQAIPRLADKTITPMASCRADLEKSSAS